MSGTAKSGPARPASKKPGKSPRRRAREFVLQGLYPSLLGSADEAAIEAHLAGSDGFDRADREFFVALLRGVLSQQEALRERLRAYLDRRFAELSPIEAGVLLTGAYELIHCPETPYRVIINEAIELAKGFGGTDGHKYVNGVIDKLAAEVRAVEIEARRKN
jgi:N utilization substance protein B